MIGYAPTRGAPVVVYGNRWCGITQLIRRTLDRAGVAYDYVDLDTNPGIERRLRWSLGRGSGSRWCTWPVGGSSSRHRPSCGGH